MTLKTEVMAAENNISNFSVLLFLLYFGLNKCRLGEHKTYFKNI